MGVGVDFESLRSEDARGAAGGRCARVECWDIGRRQQQRQEAQGHRTKRGAWVTSTQEASEDIELRIKQRERVGCNSQADRTFVIQTMMKGRWTSEPKVYCFVAVGPPEATRGHYLLAPFSGSAS